MTISIPSIDACKTQEEADQLVRKIAQALAASMKWEIGTAIDLSARLLEEVNAHEEAEIVRRMNGT